MSSSRRLLLLRHAKADSGDPEQDDHERPLARRGRRDAERMGAAITARGIAPGQVLCSSALRTRETLDRILPHLPSGLAVAVDHQLYLASPDEILARIALIEDRVSSLLVIGHNPGIAALAERLAGRGAADALARLRRSFPTGALAEIEIDQPRWRDLAPARAALASFLTPRDFAGDEE
jgi:phosphohistidine phosphatase